MIRIMQSDDYRPNTWKGLHTPRGRKASFTCPNGHTCSLNAYEILEDGSVHPSVLCPTQPCDFHEFIRLEGWAP